MPADPARVLIVSNLYPPHVIGGAEIVVQRQARLLQQRGHQVSVFAGRPLQPDNAGTLELEDVDGIRVYRVSLLSFEPENNFYFSWTASRFRSVLRAEAPDIVHFHNLAGLSFSLVPLARRLGFRTVVTLHDHAGYCYRATLLRPDGSLCTDTQACGTACLASVQPLEANRTLPMRLRRDYVAWALGWADRLAAPTAYLADAYVQAGVAPAERVSVLSNGIDLDAFAPVAPRAARDDVRFFCAANIAAHKGIPDLLEAASSLAGRPGLQGRWSLVVAGEGNLRREVEAKIAAGRFGGAVTYLGRVERARIVAEIAAADVVVLPSRWPENEPVVLLEALAAGRAQLATRTGGIPEIVRNGVTGDLVPPRDPAALADAMAAYVADPARAARQGEASRTRRADMSETNSIARLQTLYAGLVAAPPPPNRVVLCAGGPAAAPVVDLCNTLHHSERAGSKLRLLWHEWAEPGDWPHAALLWNWSAEPDHAAIRRALRAGAPVLAPAECALAAGLERAFGAARTYRTASECAALLAALPHDAAALAAMRRHVRPAADLIVAGERSGAFGLAAPRLFA